MAKLYKRRKGSYFFEREVKGGEPEIVSIFQIEKGLWGWCIDGGMTKGTFKTKKEAVEALLPQEKPAAPKKTRERKGNPKYYKLWKDGEYLGVYSCKQICEEFEICRTTVHRLVNNFSSAASLGFSAQEVKKDGTAIESDFDEYGAKYELVQQLSYECQQLRAAAHEPKKINDTENPWILKRIPNSQKPKVNGWLS